MRAKSFLQRVAFVGLVTMGTLFAAEGVDNSPYQMIVGVTDPVPNTVRWYFDPTLLAQASFCFACAALIWTSLAKRATDSTTRRLQIESQEFLPLQATEGLTSGDTAALNAKEEMPAEEIEMKRCASCSKFINALAIECRHCGAHSLGEDVIS